jgi:hypothetical protein
MHQFLEENQPNYLVYPNGTGGFQNTPQLCVITEPDIVIPDGANITWQGPRNLRSNVFIEEGGSLTIRCDVGLPENATIIVEQGGSLNIDGARVYNNCDGTYWGGIIV